MWYNNDMFIKRTKVNNTEYIQIVKSYRDGKNVRHKVVLNLGRSNKIDVKDLDNLIRALQLLRTEYTDG